MGSTGSSSEIKLFMTEKDEKELFKKFSNDFLFLKTKLFSINPKEVRFLSRVPSGVDFFIINKKIKNNFGEYIRLIKNEKDENYTLSSSLSPIIHFLRTDIQDNVIKAGGMAVFLSHYDWNVVGRRYEARQPEEFIEWWNEVKNLIKKTYTKMYYIDDISSKRKLRILYAGPDALNLYHNGYTLADFGTPCHPEGVSQKDAEYHDREFLARINKIMEENKDKPIKFFNVVTQKWEEIKKNGK